MKRKSANLLMVLILAISITMIAYSITRANAEGTATIWTNKADYMPEEAVTIYGSGFLPDTEITGTVIRPTMPEATVDSWATLSDSAGNFIYEYQLDGITGTYTVTATDGTNTAPTITFTDAPPIATTTALDSISSPLLIGLTYSFSGTVSATPSVPDGATVTLQCSDDGTHWSGTHLLFTATSSTSSGSFSGTFTATLTAGTYYFRADFPMYHGGGGDNWGASDSAIQTRTVSQGYVLTVTTNPSSIDSPTGSGTYASGDVVSISVSPNVDIVLGSSRYHFTSWSGTGIADSSAASTTVTMGAAAKTVTANYVEQFWISVTSAHGSPTEASQWVNDGAAFSVSVTNPDVVVALQHQWNLTGLTVDGSPETLSDTVSYVAVHASHTILFSWTEQWYIVVTSAHGSPTEASQWVNDGAAFSVSVTNPDVVVALQHQWNLTGLTVDGSPETLSDTVSYVAVHASHTILFSWTEQWYITFAQSGVNTDFTGTVVTIDGTNYIVTDLSKSFWWNDGSTHGFKFYSPLTVSISKQYLYSSTSGLSSAQSDALFKVTQPGSITGNYHGIVLTYTGDTSGQYSDPVTVNATLIDSISGPMAGKAITFTLGTQSVTATTDSKGVASAPLILTQPAGTYTVKAIYPGPSVLTTLYDKKGFTISQENVAITYTGDTLVFTAGQTITTASVKLAAHLVQEADGYPGDITLATVTFALFKSSNTGTTPDLDYSNVPVNASGDAQFTATISADVWTVRVTITPGNLYWTQSSEGLGILVVSLPGLSATGGGWIPDSNSANGKVNFGFMVSYQKNAAPKGNFVCVFRGSDGYDYVVKSNSWQGGGISFTGTNQAYFTGKCNVQKIDRTTGQVVASWGNYKFAVDITDGDSGSPQNTRTTDTIAITIFDSTNAIWRQIGTSAAQIPLGGGNIVVHSK
jgi:hypothetical protein